MLFLAFSKSYFLPKRFAEQCLPRLLRRWRHVVLADYVQAWEPFGENVPGAPETFELLPRMWDPGAIGPHA